MSTWSGVLAGMSLAGWALIILAVAGVVVVTAVLSSLLTARLLRRGFEQTLRPQLEEALEERLSRALEGLGEVIQERVRRGVVDGVRSLPAPNLIHETRRSVQRTASDLVKGGLASFFGPEGQRGEGDEPDEPE